MEQTKVCFRCETEQPLSQFYKHKQMADGHLNKCKTCTKKDSGKREKENRENPEWVKKEQARAREKYHRLGYKDKQLEWDKNKPWTRSNIYKGLHLFLKRKGLLSHGQVVHHWNYSEEHLRNVFIMSLEIHKKIHRHLDLDLKSKIFFFKGIPLTNKNRHYAAIMDISLIENFDCDIQSVNF